ncbi:phosphoribosylpyrophosphate synthetase [Pedobacter psychrophilus]|uniref:Phosphoribosylpyrophosphate synthetase n=1 Tax=Pedobacter psychrophilus TaxID=1826909 RepID=A0A179DD01_9SPHI|nr:phosphoribosylpyrophosphate synthetase [Pedobacter psychrophilus]OAQ38652.1 phosphoribosylpyrophosphate synthetase [Pedobacter psychrophilus]
MKLNPQDRNYDTLSEAMNDLKKRGYTYEFDFKENNIYSNSDDKEFSSNELKIVEVHRFEGMSNPDDNTILYAIYCADGSKGVLVDAYGMYADPEKTKFMADVEIVSE